MRHAGAIRQDCRKSGCRPRLWSADRRRQARCSLASLAGLNGFALGQTMGYTSPQSRCLAPGCSPCTMRQGRCMGVAALRHTSRVRSPSIAQSSQRPPGPELAFLKGGNSDKAGNPERPACGVCLRRCAASSVAAGFLNLRCNRIAGRRCLTRLGNRALYIMVKAVSSRGREDTGQEISRLRHGGLCRLADDREPVSIGHRPA